MAAQATATAVVPNTTASGGSSTLYPTLWCPPYQ